MTGEQRTLLKDLLESGAFMVYQSRSRPPGPTRPSFGPHGPQVVNTQALMGAPVARAHVVAALVHAMRNGTKRLDAVASVPFGSTWLATMAAHETGVPYLMPVWHSDPRTTSSVQGSARFGSAVWMVDSDPDADDDGRLIHAAHVVSSPTAVGCTIAGAAVLFEQDGRTRAEFVRAFPRATYVSLIGVRDALTELALGLYPALVEPSDAEHCLQLCDAMAASARNTPNV